MYKKYKEQSHKLFKLKKCLSAVPIPLGVYLSITVVLHSIAQHLININTPKYYFYINSKRQALLTGVLKVDVRVFLFKGFFFSPSSIIKEPVSTSLSIALAVANSASAPLDKVL